MIDRIDIYEIEIPLRWKYSHARAEHASVRSIICVVRDSEGPIGLGEAVPRTYVTGETPESVVKDLEGLARDFLDSGCAGSGTLETFCAWLFDRSKTQTGPFPSCAYCALELAVLDCLARRDKVPLCRLLDPEADLSPMPYTASVGMMPDGLLRLALPGYKWAGFDRFKLKVGDNADIERVRFIRSRLGGEVPIYADANGAWPKETAIRKIEQLAELGVWAVEEPLAFKLSETRAASGQIVRLELTDRHYADVRWLRDRSPIPLIADESLISPATARQIVESESFDILNIRLSKCGGFTLATELIELAREHGFRFGIGAMVAETSVLAAAGTHLGAIHRHHQYIQGYSHTVLLKHDVVRRRARLRRATAAPIGAGNPAAPGLGIELDPRRLDRITVKKVSLTP